ncbi:unnamed protein product [Calypogeia fissa]
MKEEQRGNIRQDEQRMLPDETTERVMYTRETNRIGAESHDNLDRGEEHQTTNSRSPLRADSVPLDALGDVSVEGLRVQSNNVGRPLEDDSSQENMEKWALDNAPPPVKVRREGETSEESTPKELSPPPSPKRMREVARKGKVFSQGSI